MKVVTPLNAHACLLRAPWRYSPLRFRIPCFMIWGSGGGGVPYSTLPFSPLRTPIHLLATRVQNTGVCMGLWEEKARKFPEHMAVLKSCLQTAV